MKTVVLLSGGLDSATLLASRLHQGDEVIALSASYGQKHSRELEAAEAIAEHYDVTHIEVDLTNFFNLNVDSSALLEGSCKPVPQEGYRATGMQPTYVPYRNGLFLSVATVIAMQYGCKLVAYGAHHDDAAGDAYPDCSESFAVAQENAIYLGSGKQVSLVAPFVMLTKADVVKLALELHVPLELTWSCYVGGLKPCGKCGTCIDRAKAFAANNAVDPAL